MKFCGCVISREYVYVRFGTKKKCSNYILRNFQTSSKLNREVEFHITFYCFFSRSIILANYVRNDSHIIYESIFTFYHNKSFFNNYLKIIVILLYKYLYFNRNKNGLNYSSHLQMVDPTSSMRGLHIKI